MTSSRREWFSGSTPSRSSALAAHAYRGSHPERIAKPKEYGHDWTPFAAHRKLGLSEACSGSQNQWPTVMARARCAPLQVGGGHGENSLDWGIRCGAGDENRTRMASLEGWGSAIELHPRSEISEIQ